MREPIRAAGERPRGVDHVVMDGTNRLMREITISKYKATCLAVLEDVRRTRTPVRVTRFGRPVADVVPPSAVPEKSWFGCMKDSLEVRGELVEPVGAFSLWTARRP